LLSEWKGLKIMKPVNSLQRSLLQAVRLLTVVALILSLGVAGSVHAAGPDLTVQVLNSGNFIEGGTGSTYTVIVTNVGDTPTSGPVTMDFNLNATYFTATAIGGTGWNCDLGTLTCTRSDALGGGGFSYPAITITVNVANDTPETVDNDASISGGGDVNGDNNVDFDTTNIEQVADLTIEKTHSPVEFVQGEQGAYTITVTNDGDGPTTSLVTVTEILPEGLTAVSFGGTGWSCSLATLICTRSDALAAGASYPDITLTVSVNLSANDPEINEVFVDGGGELNTANNNSVDVTDIKLQPDVRIVAYELLDANDDPLVGDPPAGSTFKVKLSVQNQGGADTPGVFYRSVYVDGLGDYMPGDPSDDIDYEFFSELEISTKPSYEHAGCLYYGDPDLFISKGTFYTSQNFLSLPAGLTDSQNSVIEISGLEAGTYDLYFYADPTCLTVEANENNNSYGPITVNVADDGDEGNVSCNPPVGGPQVFADVPTNHWARDYIEAMYYCGYTAGCSTSGPLMFCPDTTMNRAQSSVFLLRSRYGGSYVPPAPPYTTFKDDFSPGPWAQPWAQGLFNAGMTAGCNSGSFMLFCPWDSATQAQLAVFGMRMKFGDSLPLPTATGTVFADMPISHWATGWAEQAYANDLILPCGMQNGKPLFCPDSLVSRASASYTIVKAKNLLP